MERVHVYLLNPSFGRLICGDTFFESLVRRMAKRFGKKTFKVGDHVEWNSEAGRVTGIIIRKVTSETPFKGYIHHASKKEPQYFIKSDRTDHIAIHKGSALRRLKAPRSKKNEK